MNSGSFTSSGFGPKEGPNLSLTIGGTEVSQHLQQFSTRIAIDDISEASFVLRVPNSEIAWDWQGEVVATATKPAIRTMFAGLVYKATPSARTAIETDLHISCKGAAALLQEPQGSSAVFALPAADTIHWLLRNSSWPEDRMSLQGLDELDYDVFEVVARVDGLELNEPYRVGSVTLMRSQDVAEPTVDIANQSHVDAVFGSGTVGVAYVDSVTTFDGEAEGLSQIDIALAWLSSRSQDGSATRAGVVWPFDRTHTRARIQRGNGVLTRGLMSHRMVLHNSSEVDAQAIHLDAREHWAFPQINRHISRTDQLAILSWNRANSHDVAEQRVQALWDSMEYYAAATRAPRMYDESLVKALVASTTDITMTPAQRSRVTQSLQQLNSSPLMTRLKYAAELDGIDLSSSDLAILSRLRQSRNRTSHGKPNTGSHMEDLMYGISLVSRMLAARCSSHGRRRGSDFPTKN